MCPLFFKILSQLALWTFNISIYRLGISKKLVTCYIWKSKYGGLFLGYIAISRKEMLASRFVFCLCNSKKSLFVGTLSAGCWLIPLKNMSSSVGIIGYYWSQIPNTWRKKTCSKPPTSKLLEDPGVPCESNMALSFGRSKEHEPRPERKNSPLLDMVGQSPPETATLCRSTSLHLDMSCFFSCFSISNMIQ